MTPTLVNDNAVELLKSQGKQASFRATKDDSEFFSLLKQKLLSDIQKMSDTTDFDKKLDFLIDAHNSMEVFMDKMRSVLKARGRDMNEEVSRRLNKTGGFSKRIVVEGVSKLAKDYLAEVAEIKKFGEDNNYPSMNLARNNQGQVYKTFLGGKEAWDKHVKVPTNDSEEQFIELLESVRRKDINEGQGESKTKSG